MKASPDSVFALAGRTANKINSLDLPQEMVDEVIKNNNHPYWKAIEEVFTPSSPKVETMEQIVEQPKEEIFSLSHVPTGPTFGDWIEAREDIHNFLTKESVILRDIFEISDDLIARTDIIPVFRPAGATTRMAVDWKKKLGIKVWEETDVMKYKNSAGPKVPELSFIARLALPDPNTLGRHAKSPDQLIKVKLDTGKLWLNLYGWADADNLHFKILNEHLDPNDTVTWFPNDRLPDGNVARGYWGAGHGGAKFCWRHAVRCSPNFGARLATSVSLRKS